MLRNMPLIKTDLSPREIVGNDFYNTFNEYVAKKVNCFEASGFGESVRGRVANDLSKLREFGFYPVRVDERGDVVFNTVTMSKTQTIFDKDIEKHSHLNNAYVMKHGINKAIGNIKNIG